VIISIFVNPIQFGPSEDFASYPRNIPGDLEKARQVGVDIAFLPSVEEMYPQGFQTKVSAGNVTKHLCGLARPTHFDGVTTVVAKLFNITKAHFAIFGQKDYQQLTVISRMVQDLNMDIRIVASLLWGTRRAGHEFSQHLSQLRRRNPPLPLKSLDLARDMVAWRPVPQE
jgi:pantoate--beta-alanine ligase